MLRYIVRTLAHTHITHTHTERERERERERETYTNVTDHTTVPTLRLIGKGKGPYT